MKISKDSLNKHMRDLIDLAKASEGYTRPNPMVAAGLYHCLASGDLRKIADASHQAAGGAHAEAALLSQVTIDEPERTVLLITLSPCTHTGRTGPCVEAILKSGVRHVIAAIQDPNPRVQEESAREILASAGIHYELGTEWEAASFLNEQYLCNMIEKRPFVTVKVASSLDGKVSMGTQERQYLSSEASFRKVHEYRADYDAICVGIQTILMDDPQLNIRYGLTSKRDGFPYLIIVDPHFKFPSSARVLEHFSKEQIIVIGQAAHLSANREADLSEQVSIRQYSNELDWANILSDLYEDGIGSIFCEGGPRTWTGLYDADLIDKLILFQTPQIFAASSARSIFESDVVTTPRPLQQLSARPSGPDLEIQAYLKSPLRYQEQLLDIH